MQWQQHQATFFVCFLRLKRESAAPSLSLSLRRRPRRCLSHMRARECDCECVYVYRCGDWGVILLRVLREKARDSEREREGEVAPSAIKEVLFVS